MTDTPELTSFIEINISIVWRAEYGFAWGKTPRDDIVPSLVH